MLRAVGHWRDTDTDRPEPTGWRGLDVTVTAPARPGVMVQVGPGRRMRLAVGPRPIAWAVVRHDHWGTTTLVARDVPRILPPINASVARSMGSWNTDAWWSSWARWLARQLLAVPESPLSHGVWRIAPCSPMTRGVPPAEHYEQVLIQSALDEGEWNLGEDQPPLALRALGIAEDARVKAWRRAAREGFLPPLVLLWVTGLDRHVLLDGHDRLVAALAEGFVPPALAVVPLRSVRRKPVVGGPGNVLAAITRHVEAEATAGPRSWRPHRVETINQALLQAFDDRPTTVPMTRAWPLPGGPARWDAEVSAELVARGFAADSLER